MATLVWEIGLEARRVLGTGHVLFLHLGAGMCIL